MVENPTARRRFAEELLGCSLDADGYAPCPGRERHTALNGRRDFRVKLDGAPTGFCLHSSCSEAVEEFNRQLRQLVGKAESDTREQAQPPFGQDVAAKPEPQRKPKRPPFDPAALTDYASRCSRPVSMAWLRERSPWRVPAPEEQGRETACEFLAALYAPGERVLVFTQQWSQGDFLFDPERGTFRLGDKPGVKAVSSPLPEGGPEGVWYLNQPVSGKWLHNPSAPRGDGPPPPGRRHGGCVLEWRYMVLESDVAEPDLWLRALVQLPLPIAAVYTSGGRSVHALVRVDARCKAEWDALRDDLLPILCPLGADPGALTAVRLTRLPGTLRHGSRGKDRKHVRWPSPRLQELVWLNPSAPALPILQLVH